MNDSNNGMREADENVSILVETIIPSTNDTSRITPASSSEPEDTATEQGCRSPSIETEQSFPY